MSISTTTRQAFSLVELSIVLVILGLLVGGILSGRSLIRAAELRSVTAQFQGFMTADKAFRDKYFAMAGDITNATQFWGEADPDPNFCLYTMIDNAVTARITCNGDGDGYISKVDTSAVIERITYWQHLTNAGLINGQYSGYGNTHGACCYAIPANAPTGRIVNSLWWPWSSSTVPLRFQLGGQTPAQSGMPAGFPTGNILRPEELWNLDTKLDDGNPNTGKVRAAYDLPTNNCMTGMTATDTYILTNSDLACYAFFYAQ